MFFSLSICLPWHVGLKSGYKWSRYCLWWPLDECLCCPPVHKQTATPLVLHITNIQDVRKTSTPLKVIWPSFDLMHLFISPYKSFHFKESSGYSSPAQPPTPLALMRIGSIRNSAQWSTEMKSSDVGLQMLPLDWRFGFLFYMHDLFITCMLW